MKTPTCHRSLYGSVTAALLMLASGGCGFMEGPAPLPPSGESVRLLVLEGPGGGALALVPVYIDGQGPFTFALDTGASHSVIDQRLAEKLNLKAAGFDVETTGVASFTEATPVRVKSWRVGHIPVPSKILAAINMPESNQQFQLQGLLGSDVLSRYGVVLIDYDRQLLTFQPKRDDLPPAPSDQTKEGGNH